MKSFFLFQDNFLKKLLNIPILIECKKGFTCYGKLKKLDSQLNILMENSVLSIKGGISFKETKQIFLRGKIIKYIRIL